MFTYFLSKDNSKLDLIPLHHFATGMAEEVFSLLKCVPLNTDIDYCESILFHRAEILSLEDDGHISGYLTLWIALPTKYIKLKTNMYL